MLTEQEIRDRYEAYCKAAALKQIKAKDGYRTSDMMICEHWLGLASGIGSALNIDSRDVMTYIDQLAKEIEVETP